jgi:hypothetical protein
MRYAYPPMDVTNVVWSESSANGCDHPRSNGIPANGCDKDLCRRGYSHSFLISANRCDLSPLTGMIGVPAPPMAVTMLCGIFR